MCMELKWNYVLSCKVHHLLTRLVRHLNELRVFLKMYCLLEFSVYPYHGPWSNGSRYRKGGKQSLAKRKHQKTQGTLP